MESIQPQPILLDQVQRFSDEMMSQIIELFPSEFGLHNLILSTAMGGAGEAAMSISQLYQDLLELYTQNQCVFDHNWSWVAAWRQRLSFECLGSRYGCNKVIAAVHPRAQKAVAHIYMEHLDKFMLWYPWSWFSDFSFIGAGGFSSVYSVAMTTTYDPQPVPMALKVVDEKILNEISGQSKATMPLLFQGLTVSETTGNLMMVMKISNDGNLEDHMREMPLDDLDLRTVTGTILRLAANLNDMHGAGICHRNIHPRNIVCTDNDYFLVDYRFATPSNESSSVTALTKAVYGRLPYIAPEVRQGVYTEKSDIYSLGIIIWQLVTKVIFPAPEILLHEQRKGENVYRVESVPGIPEWYSRLYTACLEPVPEHRPDASVICEALRPIHDSLEYSVPLDQHVSEYIVARRAETADHLRSCAKGKDIGSNSAATRLYTLGNLPSTQHLIQLPFTHQPFSAVWPSM